MWELLLQPSLPHISCERADSLLSFAILQAADNPTPFGVANITAVKFPTAYTKAKYTLHDDPRLSDVALVFLDREFHTYMQPGVDTALEGSETVYTAGTLCLF